MEAGENNPSNKHEAFPNPPTAAFSIGQSRKPRHFTPNPVKRACVYCKGLHSLNACTTVIDKKKRHKIVRDSNLCFNCLNDNHTVSQCKTRGQCKSCHRKHLTSLCSFETVQPHDHDDKDPKKPVNPSHDHNNKGPDQSVNTVNTSPVENKESPTTTSPATFSSASIQHLNENKYISTLLKTVISPIEHNISLTSLHILFDEGSHRSFITNNLARFIGLTVDRQETLSLSTFGGSTSLMRRVEVGTINLQTPNGEGIPIEVIIVPEIAAPLQDFATFDVHSLPHLKGLTFAHPIADEHTF